jgi:hypothetical protein
MQARIAMVLMLAGAVPSYADDTALDLVVRGRPSAVTLSARIAQELGTTVTIAETCTLPCLEVSVAERKASVTFRPTSGAPRTRVVELGSDRKQWPLVITLLAGNLVRDEAADLLAQLPMGPAPAPASPAPAPASPAPAPAASAPAPAAPALPPPPLAPPPLIADEAPDTDDVPPLAAEPMTAMPVHAVLPPRPERDRMVLGVGLVPGLSTDWTHVGRVHHVLSVDLIAGVSGGSSLLTMSGIADIERGDVWGVQLAGVAAVARRVSGVQVAGIAAAAGDLTGVQIAGTAAVADRVEGLQVGGTATFARRRADSQLAGIAAVSGGAASVQVGGIAAFANGSSNLQLGGIASVAGGDANLQVGGIATVAKRRSNIQVGGVTTVARSANVQIAGVVNVAHTVRGLQLAPINVARDVEGVQVGIINVGGSADGFSFGLINIVPGGRADLEATLDSSSVGTLLFRHGGNRWHNVYGVGGHPVDESGPTDDVWMYGLGFGPSWRVAHTRIDLEAIGWQVNHGARHSSDVSILGQLRLSFAHGIGPFAIVAGGALNAYISNDHTSPLLIERRAPGTMMEESVTVEVWPSAFVGVRL